MIDLYVTFLEAFAYESSTYKINNPAWSYRMQDKGNISFGIAFDQLDTLDRPVDLDEFAPKRSDYILRMSDDGGVTFTDLQQGILTDVGLKLGHGLIDCKGYDHLHYLDQPFPFDYTIAPEDLTDISVVESGGRITSDFLYGWTQLSVREVVHDIILVANNIDSNVSYSTTFSGSWSTLFSYFIMHSDQTTMLDHIKSLAGLSSPLGFDFYIDADKLIHFTAPRFVTPTSSIVPIANFTRDNEIVDLEWHNTGPKNTRDVAIASTTGELLWAESHYDPSITQFRTWLGMTDLGETYRTSDSILRAADAIGYLNRSPQKTLTITVRPEEFDPNDESFGFKQHIGQVIHYDSEDLFLPYHRISANFWIVSQEFKSDESGKNIVCDLGLEQIY